MVVQTPSPVLRKTTPPWPVMYTRPVSGSPHTLVRGTEVGLFWRCQEVPS